jgi:methionyl-tRNA synthetase
VLNILVIIIAKIAIFLAPIMPDISENILNKIGLSIKNLTMEDIGKDTFLNTDHIIKKPEIIFHKIDNE